MNTLQRNEQRAALAAWIATHPLTEGMSDTGDADAPACSIGAINVALHQKRSDVVPRTMSGVIGAWMIPTQDEMLESVRQSPAWAALVVRSVWTGRAHETARMALVQSWMWDCLALAQPIADKEGGGVEWAAMCRARTARSARVVAGASGGELYWVIRYVCRSLCVSNTHASRSADAAGVVDAAASAGSNAFQAEFWRNADPIALLTKLVEVAEDVA